MGDNLTVKTAFTKAVDEWNHAIQANNNPQWKLHIGAAANGNPQINVQMGAPPGMGNTENGVPRFGMPNGSSQGDDIDGNSGTPGNYGGGGWGNALAIFSATIANPNYPTVMGGGAITFNPLAFWHMFNINGYDPVVAAMHEIGHAMKLDHNAGVIEPPPMPNIVYVGSIMAAQMKKGVHFANTWVDQAAVTHTYYPAMVDIIDANTSCSTCTPTPGVLAPAFAAFAFAGARRRRAG